MNILGIDIGGSGIKCAIINTTTGELISDRIRIPTPKPATPLQVAEVIKQSVDHFNWKGVVGCSFPTVVVNGRCKSAGNISPEWVAVQIDEFFSKSCNGIPFFVGNDADLAGIAEITMGAGKDLKAKVLMITVGTGIGTGLFYNRQLIPNLELGRVFYKDLEPIEKWASDAARKREDLNLRTWAARFDFFLKHVVRLTSPSHIIIGGGISKKFEKFKPYLTVNVPVSAAHFRNNAGIIGAAMFAKNHLN